MRCSRKTKSLFTTIWHEHLEAELILPRKKRIYRWKVRREGTRYSINNSSTNKITPCATIAISLKDPPRYTGKFSRVEQAVTHVPSIPPLYIAIDLSVFFALARNGWQ